jgi:hypothetical protein
LRSVLERRRYSRVINATPSTAPATFR